MAKEDLNFQEYTTGEEMPTETQKDLDEFAKKHWKTLCETAGVEDNSHIVYSPLKIERYLSPDANPAVPLRKIIIAIRDQNIVGAVTGSVHKVNHLEGCEDHDPFLDIGGLVAEQPNNESEVASILREKIEKWGSSVAQNYDIEFYSMGAYSNHQAEQDIYKKWGYEKTTSDKGVDWFSKNI